MVSHGLSPLLVDGLPTELESWGFTPDIIRRLTRLSQLYDRQATWNRDGWETAAATDLDVKEYNALLPFVVTEIQMFLGEGWNLRLESEPLS